jgi:DNA-directed RNA polymerase subunit RPC12/RpoP
VGKLDWIRKKLDKFFSGRYGLDELGNVLLAIAMIFSIFGTLAKNIILECIAMAGMVVFIYRCLSRDTYARSDENCRFQRNIKLWNLKYENRKTARVYMCPKCGKMIRVPKGKGKIQITCPKCGNRIIRRT